jgi:predicted DsbA family dithiol-disulfide isomerase
MTELRVDLFSDPVCPWCLVGMHRLNAAVARLPEGVNVEINHHPYLLDANAVPEGEDVAEMLKRKYGRDPGEMWDRLEDEARKSGLELDMRKQKMRYPSQAAQVLIAAARAVNKQHEVAFALSKACYIDALNIADPEVLADIGAAHGLDRDEILTLVQDENVKKQVEDAAQSAGQQGIQGVPFFIFDNKYALSGAQPDQVFDEVFETVIKEQA